MHPGKQRFNNYLDLVVEEIDKCRELIDEMPDVDHPLFGDKEMKIMTEIAERVEIADNALEMLQFALQVILASQVQARAETN